MAEPDGLRRTVILVATNCWTANRRQSSFGEWFLRAGAGARILVEGGEGFGGSISAEEREELRWSANASVEAWRRSGGAGTYLGDANRRTDRKRGSTDNAVIAVGWLLKRGRPRFF
jgi:hypothetical protein